MLAEFDIAEFDGEKLLRVILSNPSLGVASFSGRRWASVVADVVLCEEDALNLVVHLFDPYQPCWLR